MRTLFPALTALVVMTACSDSDRAPGVAGPEGQDGSPSLEVIGAPAGFTEGFESGSFDAWDDGYDATRHRIITDASRAHTGSRALSILYPRGGDGGYLNKFFMPGVDSARVSYWVKFPTTWKGGTFLFGLYASRTDDQWSGHGKAATCPTGRDFSTAFVITNAGTNPIARFSTIYPGMPTTDGVCLGDLGIQSAQYVPPLGLKRGVWHKIELAVKLNTPGASDGAQWLWVDGVLRGTWRSIRFRDTDELRLNSFQLSAYVPNGAPQQQRLLVDDIAISWGSGSPPPPPPGPAPVASIAVVPPSASVAVGSTVQFVATTLDSTGNVLTGRAIEWRATAPSITVSASGLVTGVSAGTASVIATSEGKSDTSAVTVTAATPPPPPPPPSGDTIFYEGFESGSFAAWEDGYDASKHRIVTNATFARAGSRYLEVTAPQGDEGSWLTHFFMPGFDSVFVRLDVRLDNNWQGWTKYVALYGSRTDNQWSAFGRAGACPNGTDFFAAMLIGEPFNTDPPTHFYTYYPAMQREPNGITCWGSGGDGRERYFPPLTLSKGSWHRIEYWLKLNTPGQSNTVQRFWIDGVLRGEWSGISLRTSDILKINSVQLAFSICCGGAPQTQRMYVDEVLVTTGNGGGAETPTPPPPPPSPTLQQITVSPTSANLVSGALQQFTATARMSDGSTQPADVVWSATGGTISNGGLYVAGTSAGTFEVRATQRGGTISGTSSVGVSVTPPPPPPPPPPSGGGVLLYSDWSYATGLTADAIQDGPSGSRKWDTWNNYLPLAPPNEILQVVPATGLGFPAGMANVLRVRQRGSIDAEEVMKRNLPVPAVGEHRYFRVYTRVDEGPNSYGHDHVIQPDFQNSCYNLWKFKRQIGTTGWHFMWEFSATPGNEWYSINPLNILSKGVVYRIEWHIHRTGTTTFKFDTRIYDVAGRLLYDDDDFVNEDMGGTLASRDPNFNISPSVSCFNTFFLGNNGQVNFTGNNTFTYYGGVEIRSDTWAGAWVPR